MNRLASLPSPTLSLPAVIAAGGERASYRFLEFFTSNIRNPHTRRAYARAAKEFFDWLEARGVAQLAAIVSVHVAAYIEQLQRARSAPTAKLRLAALRQPRQRSASHLQHLAGHFPAKIKQSIRSATSTKPSDVKREQNQKD